MSNAEPEVLDSTSIKANVDFSLTKDDLTDMILEDRFEVLEDQLDAVCKRLLERNKEMAAIDEEHKELLISTATKALSKKIKAAEKFLGKAAEAQVSTHNYFTVAKRRQVKYVTFEKNYNSSRRRKVEKWEELEGWRCFSQVDFGISFVEERDKDKNRADGFEVAKGSWGLTKAFSQAEIEATPTYQKLIALDEERVALIEQKILLQIELDNLETSGKRARAKMVKALLSASEQGRQLLSKMPTMNQNLLTA